jgi:ATP-dependent Lon protease
LTDNAMGHTINAPIDGRLAMSHHEDDLVFMPQQFSGRVRLFPLPNLVLFPHVVQPLHIFEPRYVQMFEAALADDRLITMAHLTRGWETNYEGRPPIEPVACLGRILSWQPQPDSRYNVLLLGLRRVRVVRELPPQRVFREAEVELLEDEYPTTGDRKDLQRRLVAAFEGMLPRIADAQELFDQLSMGNVSLGTLTDVISYAIGADMESKQALLAEQNVDRRARMLLAQLKRTSSEPAVPCVPAGFPPAFSTN